MEKQTVVIIDFGGQYKELIARRVRECGVYSIIKPNTITPGELKEIAPIGIILTGGPKSVCDPKAPLCDSAIFNMGIPILGICYGMQVIAHTLGGAVGHCGSGEYGVIEASIEDSSALFEGLDASESVLMSHADMVTSLPAGFDVTARTALCPVAAFEDAGRKIYGLQFHPEVTSTVSGKEIINNFLYRVCRAAGDYSMEDYLAQQIKEIREQVGGGRVLLGLSGGVDSSVCAALISEALPGQLTCVYVDHGCMRKGETDQIRRVFAKRNLDFVYVDASDRFLGRLSGVTDPERKRKIIGEEFIRTFEDEAEKLGNPEFLGQGTIYPDIVESGNKDGSDVVKSHHNVGGLPDNMKFKGLVEPLKGLFKDEVRRIGLLLGLPRKLVYRQPFPGPGLAVRTLGEVTRDKLDILREADFIVREEIEKSRVRADQYFAVLVDTRSVGVMGDARTYDRTVAVRAVVTNDFMTCEYARLPHSLLARISTRITNEVKGINRVVFDITGKPPATIEWE